MWSQGPQPQSRHAYQKVIIDDASFLFFIFSILLLYIMQCLMPWRAKIWFLATNTQDVIFIYCFLATGERYYMIMLLLEKQRWNLYTINLVKAEDGWFLHIFIDQQAAFI